MSSPTPRIVVFGAGGFAREVRWLIEEINREEERFRFRGYAISDLTKLSHHDSSDEVLGDIDWLDRHRLEWDALALGIGSPTARARVSEQLQELFPNAFWPPLVHPTARYDQGSCQVAQGALICAGVIGTVNVSFDAFCLVNLACTLGHEARIGRCSVLNPTVNVSGGASLGARVLVGTGAQILQYLTIGEGATIGAGSVVTRDIAPGTTVVGVPAKPLSR